MPDNKKRYPRWVGWIIAEIGHQLFEEYVWPLLKDRARAFWALVIAAWTFLKCFLVALKTVPAAKAAAICACAFA
jgi:hypothetical protein